MAVLVVETVEMNEVLRHDTPLARMFENAGERLGMAVEKTRRLATRINCRAHQIKEQQPLQFLAVLAGAAFAAGVATRVWRARRNA